MSSFRLVTLLVFLLLGISSGISQDIHNLDLINSHTYFASKLQEYAEGNNNLSPICSYSLTQYALGLLTLRPWALSMFDSGAKIPSGILLGHFVDLGTFDQCIDIETTLNRSIYVAGRYCLGTISFNLQLGPNGTTESSISLDGPSSRADSPLGDFQLARCMPSTCSPAEIQDILSGVLINTAVSEQSCQTKEEQPELDGGAIGTLAFLAVILAIMIASTIYDTVLHYTERKTAHSLLTAFSVLTNGKKILQLSKAPGQISCMHGLRVISTMWVVLAHRFTIGSKFPLHNITGYLDLLVQEGSMYLIGAPVSVDTFFLMAGFVISYSYMNSIKKGIKFNIIKHYLHRYLRLTPVLAVLALIHITLLKYMGSGPIYLNVVQDQLITPCQDNWWKALLYIQNYVENSVVCIPQSWYLSVDTQLFLLSPIILLPLGKYPKITLIFVAILTVASSVAGFVTAWVYELKGHGMDANIIEQDVDDHQALYYTATHTRAGVWLIGIALGYLMFKINQRETRVVLNKWLALSLWAVSMTVMASCVFAGHNLLLGQYNRLANAFFDSLMRPAWALGCSWVILGCSLGYGGPVNWFLSMPIFEVLSKLTYSTYLCHHVIIYLVSATMRVPPWFSAGEFLYVFWGDFMLSLVAALVLALAFEFPMVTIDNFLLGGSTKKKTGNHAKVIVK